MKSNLHLGTGIGEVQKTGPPAVSWNFSQVKVVIVSPCGWRSTLILIPSFARAPILLSMKFCGDVEWRRHRARMWLGVPTQTMHTGSNGMMAVEIAGALHLFHPSIATEQPYTAHA